MNKWILLSLILLAGCGDSWHKMYGPFANVKQVDGKVCIYTKDARPGDTYTAYLLHKSGVNSNANSSENERYEYPESFPAWNHCLPNERIKPDINWTVSFLLKNKNGESKRYVLDFIWRKNGEIALTDIFQYQLNRGQPGVVNGSPFPDD